MSRNPGKPAPPADADEALAAMRELFAECNRSARLYFKWSEADGLDFDMRCAYATVANRMVRAAALVAAAIARPPGGESVHRVVVERA